MMLGKKKYTCYIIRILMKLDTLSLAGLCVEACLNDDNELLGFVIDELSGRPNCMEVLAAVLRGLYLQNVVEPWLPMQTLVVADFMGRGNLTEVVQDLDKAGNLENAIRYIAAKHCDWVSKEENSEEMVNIIAKNLRKSC